MKGLLHVILIATPLAALLVFFWLSQRHEVGVQAQRTDTEIRLDAQRFDKQFDRMTSSIDPSLSVSDKEKAAQDKRIAKLQSKLSGLDDQVDHELQDSAQDAKQARSAVSSAGLPMPPMPSAPAMPPLPEGAQ